MLLSTMAMSQSIATLRAFCSHLLSLKRSVLIFELILVIPRSDEGVVKQEKNHSSHHDHDHANATHISNHSIPHSVTHHSPQHHSNETHSLDDPKMQNDTDTFKDHHHHHHSQNETHAHNTTHQSHRQSSPLSSFLAHAAQRGSVFDVSSLLDSATVEYTTALSSISRQEAQDDVDAAKKTLEESQRALIAFSIRAAQAHDANADRLAEENAHNKAQQDAATSASVSRLAEIDCSPREYADVRW